jgi:hypothetical protein
MDTIKKTTQAVIDVSNEVGLEIYTEKTKYMLKPRHQNARQNHDKEIANRSLENLARFKYS